MTELKKATLEMIESAPDEFMEEIFPLVKNILEKLNNDAKEEEKKRKLFAKLDELFAKEPPMTEEQRKIGRERARIFEESVKAIDKIIGGEIPWASEEEMIEEIRQDRRERMKNANYA